jgi:putative endonuclease
MKGYVYILECANGFYYVGSTINLKLRIREHQDGLGANFTHKHFPMKLVYFETYKEVAEAFDREKQLQKWSRKKKEALIYGHEEMLPALAACKNKSSHRLFRKQSQKKESSDDSPLENPNPSVAED